MKTWFNRSRWLYNESSFASNSDTCTFFMQVCRQARTSTGFGPNWLHLPTPRLVLLVLRGLVLAWVDEPVLPVVLVTFLAPAAPSLCLVEAAALPAVFEEAGRVALCCFLAWASRGRAWFARAGGLVSDLSEQIRGSRKEKFGNSEVKMETESRIKDAHLCKQMH